MRILEALVSVITPRLRSLGLLFFDDANQTKSTWTTDRGVPLTNSTAEWNSYKGTFGEVSLFNALQQSHSAGITVNGAKATTVNYPADAVAVAGNNVTVSPTGVEPEFAVLSPRSVYQSWWTGVSGLTPIKYFDARYPAQTLGPVAEGVVTSWDDLVGGADAVQVAAVNNPTLRLNGFPGDGGQFMEFRPSGSDQRLLSCASLASLTVPFTLFAVMRHNIIDYSVKNIVAMSSGGGLQWYMDGAGAQGWFQNGAGTAVTMSNTNARLTTTKASLHAFCVNGANSFLWDNGVKQTGVLSPGGTWVPTVAYVGGYGPAQNGGNYDLRGLACFNGAATQANIEAVFSGLCGHVPVNIVCVGDSMTEGRGGTPYPTQLQTAVNGWGWVDTDALGGTTLLQMSARFTANVTPKYKADLRNVLVLWAGTNDIYFAADGPTTLSRYWAYCDMARKAGWRVVAVSIIPRAPFSAAQVTAVDYFNVGQEQRFFEHADALVQLHRIKGLTAVNNELWDTEGVHLDTTYGNGLVSRAICKAISALT